MTKVIVYNADGQPEQHTRANARDLVYGAGYSWSPVLKSSPTAYAPFAQTSIPDGPAPSQKVLDSVGSATAAKEKNAGAMQAQAEAVAQALAEQQAAEAAALAAKEDAAEAAAVEAAEEAKPAAKPRAKK